MRYGQHKECLKLFLKYQEGIDFILYKNIVQWKKRVLEYSSKYFLLKKEAKLT